MHALRVRRLKNRPQPLAKRAEMPYNIGRAGRRAVSPPHRPLVGNTAFRLCGRAREGMRGRQSGARRAACGKAAGGGRSPGAAYRRAPSGGRGACLSSVSERAGPPSPAPAAAMSPAGEAQCRPVRTATQYRPRSRGAFLEEKALSELLLQTRNLTKQYGRHRAVDDVNMHIKKGAIYGFIGRNGAGKTTCLKMISGLSTPSYGEIEMFGYKGKDLQKVRSRVGCLIEAPGLYGNMSAYDNLNIKCKLTGIKKKGYIEELLKTVGLDTVGEKKTKHYSLGMKQRLGIALALVGEPDLLILDEPINGLDPQGIVEVRETIQKLAKERGMTICISSHILEELSKIATDYGIIHNGCLVQELTREELMKKCSERIELTLDNPKQAVPVLDDMGFSSYQVIDKEHIHIFERLGESASLNMELAKAGIPVKGISITSEELENYFLRLTGGDNRA